MTETIAANDLEGWDLQTLVAWVEERLLPVYTRPVDRAGLHWCPTWWRHTEAWVRFEACHRAWRALAGDAGIGLSVWHRDHLDPMLRELLADTGPFAHCSPSEGHEAAQHRAAGDYGADPVVFELDAPVIGAEETHP